MSRFIGWFKQLNRSKQIALILPCVLASIFFVAAMVHGMVTRQNARELALQPSASPTPTFTCPDSLIYNDAVGAVQWVKGDAKHTTSGEEEQWIQANCSLSITSPEASLSPSQQASATVSPSSKTKATPTPKSSSTPVMATPDTTSPSSSTATATPTATPTPTPTPTATPAPEPLLKNLAVSFAPYDAQTGRAGSFDFLSLQRKPFDEFGLNGTEPTFTFLTAEDAEVTAVADGYVYKVEYQSTYSDYSILASTAKDDLTWSIDYDHIINPTVSVGDAITAGQKLGIVGTHSDIGIGRVEIQVFGGTGTPKSYCPFNYFSSSLNATYKAKLQQLMDDYEAFNHITTYYPDSYPTHTGCLASSLGL